MIAVYSDKKDLMQYLYALYSTLRNCRRDYDASDYKWKIGVNIIVEIEIINTTGYTLLNTATRKQLFGIDVEIDYENADNIQLYEDITKKIAVYDKPLYDDITRTIVTCAEGDNKDANGKGTIPEQLE